MKKHLATTLSNMQGEEILMHSSKIIVSREGLLNYTGKLSYGAICFLMIQMICSPKIMPLILVSFLIFFERNTALMNAVFRI